MKKLLLLLVLAFITPLFSFAASGACSGHGGVSCSAGPDRDGSVICVDGWKNSSVSYSSMVKCGGYSIPTTPAKEQQKIAPQPVKVTPSQLIGVVSPDSVMPATQEVETKIAEVTPIPQKKVGFWARVFSFFR